VKFVVALNAAIFFLPADPMKAIRHRFPAIPALGVGIVLKVPTGSAPCGVLSLLRIGLVLASPVIPSTVPQLKLGTRAPKSSELLQHFSD
jgi:hypothetical protein